MTRLLRIIPIGPLVNEAGLGSAESLLANKQRGYANRAFEVLHRNPIGSSIRSPLHPVSLFTKLSRWATQDIPPQFSGQDVVETTFIRTSRERIAVPVFIESRKKAEQTALSINDREMRCIWTDGCRDDLGYVGAAVA
jgi:hypothetical protein